MAKIFADRILAGTRKFSKVPDRLKSEVKSLLEEMAIRGDISVEHLNDILNA